MTIPKRIVFFKNHRMFMTVPCNRRNLYIFMSSKIRFLAPWWGEVGFQVGFLPRFFSLVLHGIINKYNIYIFELD